MISTLEKAAAQIQKKLEETTPEPSAPIPSTTNNATTATALKKPNDAIPPIPKALTADKVREEFEKAASVIRKYFESPPAKELAALLRHPDTSMPRYREWSQKNRIVPAVPLRIGPQFGTAGSLLVTPVKMADGSSRLAALENTQAGYLLDWESFSAWGESRFVDLPAASTTQPILMRVTVKPSSATAPKTSALSFTLSHPDERTTLAAYASPEVMNVSPASRKLRDNASGMFALRLSMNAENIKSGWACIHEVVCSGWVDSLPAETDPKTAVPAEE